MRGRHSLVGSFLFVVACSAAPVPEGSGPGQAIAPRTVAVPAPAPLGEGVAVTDDRGGTRHGAGVALAYGRTMSLDHDWPVPGVGRMHVSFEMSFSAPVGWRDLATTSALVRWDEGQVLARRICEQSDLTTMVGLDACSARLCRELTPVLFDDGSGEPLGRIERVIWNSVHWH